MSRQILEACKEFIPEGRFRILDPFAGVGTTSLLLPEHDVVGIEIEKEWAEQNPNTIHGDCKKVIPTLGQFDIVLTSPAYGNRMADDFIAKDTSRRMTYRHSLGRPLTAGTSSNLHFGRKNSRYEDLHTEVWSKCVDCLKHGGLFILNCKDFISMGKLMEVTSWHVDHLTSLGLVQTGWKKVKSSGVRFGSNHNIRVDQEDVVCLKKP